MALLRTCGERAPGFAAELDRLSRRGETDLDRVEAVVRAIVRDVRGRGDAALRDLVEKYEQRTSKLLQRDYGGESALRDLSPTVRRALESAAERIRRYHEHQKAGIES